MASALLALVELQYIYCEPLFCYHSSPRAFYGYSAGVAAMLHCIIAISCTCTLLEAIFFDIQFLRIIKHKKRVLKYILL